jgi:NDP-sugar pyrophosphorylase family protein
MRAIGSVSVEGASMKYSFIVRQEHIERYHIDEQIRAIIPEANIFSVEKTTRGAVETCLIAESAIDENDAVIVMDCDLEFRSKTYIEGVRTVLNQSADEANGGMLVSFESTEPRYSYAEVDDNMIVKRTAEKEVISGHALCGAYFFSSAKGFLNAAHQLMNEPVFTKPEYYVSLLYNYLLANGETVRLATMEEYYSYGTPDELRRYL